MYERNSSVVPTSASTVYISSLDPKEDHIHIQLTQRTELLESQPLVIEDETKPWETLFMKHFRIKEGEMEVEDLSEQRKVIHWKRDGDSLSVVISSIHLFLSGLTWEISDVQKETGSGYKIWVQQGTSGETSNHIEYKDDPDTILTLENGIHLVKDTVTNVKHEMDRVFSSYTPMNQQNIEIQTHSGSKAVVSLEDILASVDVVSGDEEISSELLHFISVYGVVLVYAALRSIHEKASVDVTQRSEPSEPSEPIFSLQVILSI